MPILSATVHTSYPGDAKFKPITTLTGNDVPDYGLDFDVPTTYRGDEFAFDSCDNPSLLVSRDIIEEDFLLCRYERLFKYKLKTTAPVYYLVPWMGVPATRTTTGEWQMLDNLYTLEIKPVRFTKALRESGPNARKRTLRLVPSNSNIKAVWDSQKNATVNQDEWVAGDITAISKQLVRIVIIDGTHNETGEYIEIKEVLGNGSNGKTVGKVRILFLETLTQPIFLINVTDNGDHYTFNRLAASEAPIALESDGLPNYLHGNAIDEANGFGFKQIGVELHVEGNDVDMYDANDERIFFDESDSAKTYELEKTDVVAAVLAAGQSNTPENLRSQLFQMFLEGISYVGNSSQKFSKYSRIYTFVTEFYSPGNPGVSFDSSNFPVQTAKKASAKLSIPIPRNVCLYRWLEPSDIISPVVVSQREAAEVGYSTVVHECAHALLVEHYFDETTPAEGSGAFKPFFKDCFEANKWLRLYLLDDFVPEIASSFDAKKVCIEDFKTSASRTLFDEIIDQGITPAIEAFIDAKIFPDGRPAHWKPEPPEGYKTSSTAMPLADLVIWRSLNDLVKFTQYATRNIMDYAYYSIFGNPQDNELYVQRRTVRFSRFQWELARKTIRRLGDLTFLP